ncbi:MAG: phosphatidylserine decarboxylase [bacterium]|nr:phosphatidylserine decarboxylase [bacterium]
MNFAREAWPFVLPPFIFGIVALLWGMRGSMAWLLLGGGFLVLLAAAILLFFRDPDRTPPNDPKLVVSPADGVVVDTETLPSGEKFVAIFLSVFDVHVNRSPYAGKVTKITSKPGTYLHANSAEGIQGNARIDVELVSAYGPIRFSQLSGLVARKISCRVSEGDSLATGQRYGLIYFGSRMEIVLPASAEIVVKPGIRTAAGETVIAAFRGNDF